MHEQRRITLLTTGLALAGAEEQTVLLAVGLHQRGWRVQVISMLPPQAHAERLTVAGVQVVLLGVRKDIPDARPVIRLARTLWRFRPHVLHCHQVHANLLGRLIRCITPASVVISTAHSISEGPPWREWAYRHTDVLCDLTTNVSQAAVDRYLRVGVAPPDKLVLVPNGVDTSAYAPNPEIRSATRAALGLGDRFAWLAVGNLREPKDYPNLLAAVAKLRNDCRDLLLLIAGAGPLEGRLQEIIRTDGLADMVKLLGHRTDVASLMNAADAFVISSAWEGLPMVLLEASACGLPIVATQVGGNAEVVLNGQSGLLEPPHDPEKLADAMGRIMRLPTQSRRGMGLAGRAHVIDRYSLGSVIDRWEEIYAQLLTAKNAHRESLWA